MRAATRRIFQKMLGSGHVWAALAAGFFIGCGLLMQHNGVEEFRFAGGRYSGSQQAQAATPEMLLWLGAIILVLNTASALLFRADQLQQERAKAGTGDTLLP